MQNISPSAKYDKIFATFIITRTQSLAGGKNTIFKEHQYLASLEMWAKVNSHFKILKRAYLMLHS